MQKSFFLFPASAGPLTELDSLQELTGQAVADGQTESNTLSGNMDSLISDINTAKNAVNGLSSAITNWSNENIGQINDMFARLSWAVSQAEPILDSMGSMMDTLKEASSLLDQAADIAAGAGEQGTAAAEELRLASQDLQAAVTSAQTSVSHVNAAVEIGKSIVNGNQSEDAVQSLQNELNAAKTEAENMKALLASVVSHVDAAKACLNGREDAGSENADDLLDNIFSDGENTQGSPNGTAASGSAALDSLTQVTEKLNSVSNSAGEIVEQIIAVGTQLAEEPVVSFSPVNSNVTTQGDALDGALSQMLQSAAGLQGSISSSSDTLLGDFNAIHEQIGVIVELLEQQLNEAQEKDAEDSVEDVSDADEGEASSGKIRGSDNSGEVAGDINVAGIVGSLSVEYDFDPEDDLTEEGSRSLDFQCKTLAVVTGCTNDGSISAKKNYAGGIVGRMDLGAVKNCESYGNVESSNGDYVGGIAGLSRATIRNCFVKCTLSGGDYIGGVIGSGEEDSVVSDCYTLVDIPVSGSCVGAVSGTETGEFSGNSYVSDTLAGLGRISYAGKAEPIDFSTLSQVKGMPEKMTQFTLRFLVEDKELESCTFSYGDSFGEDVFPDIPVKDGCYAKWDTDDLTELHFDKTVTAEYERYVLTLASLDSRDSGRPIFLMDGDFDEDAKLTVADEEASEMINGEKAIEIWKLTCSDSSQENYTIRYLSPEETPEGYVIFVKQDGTWKKADTESFGSYLVFSVTDAETEVAVALSASVWIWRVGMVLLVIILLVIFGILVHKHRKKKVKELPEKLPQTEAKKKKWWIIAIIGAAIVGLAAVIILWKKVGEVADAYALLQDFTEQTEYAVSMTVDAELDGQLAYADIDMTKTVVDGHSVTGIQTNGISLYYADNSVILENGKAYKISALHPDYTEILTEAAKMYQKLSFTTEKEDGNTVYCLTAEGDNAKDLLSILIPDQAEHLSDTQKVEAELTVAEDEIQSLAFTSEGTLLDSDKTPYTVSAKIMPEQVKEGYEVPELVKETVCSGETENLEPITEDLFRLLSAWTELQQEEAFTADFTLGAQCGPITLDEEMQYAQVKLEDCKIEAIRKGDFVVYFSDGSFCDQSGNLLNEEENEGVDRARLLEVLYQICINGEFSCTDTGNDTWLYTLSLDEENMKNVAYTVIPEMSSMEAVLKEGSIQISVKDTMISEIICSCTGGLDALADAAPVTVSAEFVFSHNSKEEIPDAVREQFSREGVEEDEK